MNNTAVNEKISVLDDTIDMLSMLSEEDLKIVSSVVNAFASKHNADKSSPFKPKTEAEFIRSFEESLKHVSQGMFKDADTLKNELETRYGL